MNTRRKQAYDAAVMIERKARRGTDEWMMFIFPNGCEAELYRSGTVEVRCAWPSGRPDFKKRNVRKAILTHWLVAVGAFSDQFGPAGRIIGGAYKE